MKGALAVPGKADVLSTSFPVNLILHPLIVLEQASGIHLLELPGGEMPTVPLVVQT